MGGFSDVYSVTLLCLNLNSDCETYYNSVVSCVPIMEFPVFSSVRKRTEFTFGQYIPGPGIHGPLVHI